MMTFLAKYSFKKFWPEKVSDFCHFAAFISASKLLTLGGKTLRLGFGSSGFGSAGQKEIVSGLCHELMLSAGITL